MPRVAAEHRANEEKEGVVKKSEKRVVDGTHTSENVGGGEGRGKRSWRVLLAVLSTHDVRRRVLVYSVLRTTSTVCISQEAPSVQPEMSFFKR